MRVAAELTIEGEDDTRRAGRAPVAVTAAIRKQGERGIDGHLLDLSTHGFKFEAECSLRTGWNVWLKLPGMEALFARIAWSEGRTFGCEFSMPLHRSVVDRIVTLEK